MAMGDALAMVMIDARQFDKESYALNHPAGAIGRALVMRVSDVMRVGDRCALVSPDTTVLDTLLAMTKAQGGSAVVVNGDGTLAGIFTDGDFRRGFAAAAPSAASALLAASVADHMTCHPLFVRDTAYAVDLLRIIFERKRVDDLPVCDDAGRVVGLVDIQDLPKLKVL